MIESKVPSVREERGFAASGGSVVRKGTAE